MADGTFAAVRVGQQDHVAFLDRSVEAAQESVDKATELPNDHLARRIGDQGKGIALFADAGRHRGPHQRCIHFDPGIA